MIDLGFELSILALCMPTPVALPLDELVHAKISDHGHSSGIDILVAERFGVSL